MHTTRTVLCAALHNIRSLYNVGSVFRTASGAGVGQIFLSGYTGSPPDPRIAKVALGAEQEIPFQSCTDTEKLLHALDSHYVIALEQNPDSTLYGEITPPTDQPVTVLLGEELFGLPAELIERADAIAEIPMSGAKESLNVASAFAVVIYDLAIKLGSVDATDLRSRAPTRPPRPGVLTQGPTTPSSSLLRHAGED